MSPRPVRPSSIATHGPVGPWVIPAVAVVAVLGSTVLWLVGGVATVRAGQPWPDVPWQWLAVLAVPLSPEGIGGTWPAADPSAVAAGTAVITGGLLLAAGLVVAVLAGNRPRADSPWPALAGRRDLQHLLLPQVRGRARQLRRSLSGTAPRRIAPADAGIALGTLDRTGRSGSGPLLLADQETSMLCLMAPRSGKTTALAIPTILAAPGAVVATSNKAELLATEPLRTGPGRRCWVFDPQSIAHRRQEWWWNPLREVRSIADAERLAGHFISTVEDKSKRDIWGPAATELLSALILAAAYSDRTLSDVYSWLADEQNPEPATILDTAVGDHGESFHVQAASLRGLTQAAPETRASVAFTARSGARCLRDGRITSWVCPPPAGPRRALPEFCPSDFVAGRDTLFCMSKESGGSAAPLVASLTDAVMRAGLAAAERLPGGRLDPPLTLVLDEAASIAPISDLPQKVSYTGSRGVLLVVILQTMAQARTVWGAEGAKILWDASVTKILGAGLDDPDLAESVSRLIGTHDVATTSHSSGSRQHGVQTSVRQQRILEAAQVRALPKGRALLLTTGAPPALIRLLPWYEGPQRKQIAEAAAAAEARIAADAAAAARRADL